MNKNICRPLWDPNKTFSFFHILYDPYINHDRADVPRSIFKSLDFIIAGPKILAKLHHLAIC